jgi:hypothetical protein
MTEPTIRFPVTCHDVIWTATELELEQIHEHLLVLTEPLRRLSSPLLFHL